MEVVKSSIDPNYYHHVLSNILEDPTNFPWIIDLLYQLDRY